MVVYAHHDLHYTVLYCMCVQVRTFNVEKTKNMRALNPEGELSLSLSLSCAQVLILMRSLYSVYVCVCVYVCACADIDQLITISGMVIRTSPLIPEMREGENIFSGNLICCIVVSG